MNELATAQGTRQESRYARKVRERTLGIRPPFQFRDSPAPEPWAPRPPVVPVTIDGWPQTLRARVTKLALTLGCLFLELEDGQQIYMNIKVLKRDFGREGVKMGMAFECVVEPHPNWKGLCATRILRTVPT